jgi:hypothetical protein
MAYYKAWYIGNGGIPSREIYFKVPEWAEDDEGGIGMLAESALGHLPSSARSVKWEKVETLPPEVVDEKISDANDNLVDILAELGSLCRMKQVPADPGPVSPCTGKLIYLATPYSHPDEEVRLARVEAVNRAAAEMMGAGLFVFSPVSHLHPITVVGGLPGNWGYWESYCRATIGVCGKVVVLMQDGWEESTGVKGEIAIAATLGIPVDFLSPDQVGRFIEWHLGHTEENP